MTAIFSLPHIKEKQIRADNKINPLIAFHLFDALVVPALLYGSEIWGCYGKAADTMQLSFIRRVLRLLPAMDTITAPAESGGLLMHIKLNESQAQHMLACLVSEVRQSQPDVYNIYGSGPQQEIQPDVDY